MAGAVTTETGTPRRPSKLQSKDKPRHAKDLTYEDACDIAARTAGRAECTEKGEVIRIIYPDGIISIETTTGITAIAMVAQGVRIKNPLVKKISDYSVSFEGAVLPPIGKLRIRGQTAKITASKGSPLSVTRTNPPPNLALA